MPRRKRSRSSSGLLQQLRQFADGFRQLDRLNRRKARPLQCYSTYGYVAAKGKPYRSEPLTDAERAHLFNVIDQSCRRFPIKQCFYNSQMVAVTDKTNQLKYVEGFVADPRVPIPIHHGWLTLNGKVIDLTLRRTRRGKGRLRDRAIGTFGDRQYVGVEFSKDYVLRYMLDTGQAGTLIDDYERGYPLQRDEGCFRSSR
jgi:hypothetical protein